jgi:protein TonB
MAIHKAPHADLRRMLPIHRELGAVLALAVTIGAFTVPLPNGEDVAVVDDVQEIIELQDVEQTQQSLPPPPPPAALPPPQEVPDDIAVEEEVIEEITLDLTAEIVVPPAPPPAPVAPPPPPTSDAPPPPPPPPPDPEPTEPEIFEVAEVQPELIGGLTGLQSRVVYPELAIRAGVEGQVVVQFVVDERGNVVDPVVLRTPNPLLTEAALTAVTESRFTPGQQRGRPVSVRYAVPVTFTLVAEH